MAGRTNVLLAAGGVRDGYGLILGEMDAARLAAMARQSNLTWYWAAGGRDVSGMRQSLDDAGLYGTRVAIHNTNLQPLPYADYTVNLLVFEVGAAADLQRVAAAEVRRVLRPNGGVAVVACAPALRPAVQTWLDTGRVPRAEWQDIAVGVRIQRGALPGAGAWTHQYADAGKSGASADQQVRLPLKMLWFGSLGPGDIVSRHYRAPVPLAIDGRLFVAGMDHVHALDAYNGRVLWERNLPDVGRWPAAYRGGVMAVDGNALYVLYDGKCLRLDRDTGKTLFTYRPAAALVAAANALEKKENTSDDLIWEYLAVTEDAVVGTLGAPNIRRSWWSMAHPSNHVLFVLDKATGKLRWSYQPRNAVDSNAIAIAGNRLFLIDGLAPADVFARLRRGVNKKPARNAKPKLQFRVPGSPGPRSLVALDLRSGKQLWTTREIGARQDWLYTAGGVALSTVPVWHGLSARQEGPAVSAFSADDGRLLWTHDAPAPYPVIIDDVVYLPAAYDLHTGTPIQRPDPLTGELASFSALLTGSCARLAGCPGLLTKRSGALGFFDLRQLSGVYHYPNVRASCWINMIPACGLVLVPEGSSSCPCAYNYKTSLALMPAHRYNNWGLYTSARNFGKQPIEHLRLNFGAPGDRTDADNAVWFAFPRPSTNGPRGAGGMGRVPFVRLPIDAPGLGKTVTSQWRNPDWTPVPGTDRPWLLTSALVGPLKLNIRLAPSGVQARPYRVTLYFRNVAGQTDSPRFDVTLDGRASKSRASSGEVKRAQPRIQATVSVELPAGTPAALNRPVIKEITVRAADQLSVQLIPTNDVPPVISGMRIEQLDASDGK